jgi:hypothetical protein
MILFSSFRIGTRLAAGFGLVLLLTIILNEAITQMDHVTQQNAALVEEAAAAAASLKEQADALANVAAGFKLSAGAPAGRMRPAVAASEARLRLA